METILDYASYVFWVLLAITILVFVHEMGHFLFAKLFGMRVERFSVGFPPKVFGKQVGETEYVVGATPLGGYVKIAGMVDESMDTDFAGSAPEPWEFRAKPVWQRIIVITAGVIFNVILAGFIFIGLKAAYGEAYIPAENIESVYVADSSVAYQMGLRTGDRIVAINGATPERMSDLFDVEALLADRFTIAVERDGRELTLEGPEDIMTQLNRSQGAFGVSVDPSLIGGISPGSPAEAAGLQPGDRIVAINDTPVRFWLQMTDIIGANAGDTLRVRWQRLTEAPAGDAEAEAALMAAEGPVQVYETEIVPELTDGRYLMGVASPSEAQREEEFGIEREDYSLGEAVTAGIADTWVNTRVTAVSLWRVFSGRENLRENLGGPVMVAQVTKRAADAGPRSFWFIVAMLSITLAIINILPIPALDGGHLMFLIYEGITRREPSLKVRMVTQQIGMVLLLAFMTFLIFNDILRL